MPITFAVAVNSEQLFESNLLASPCFREPHGHQIIVQRNFRSAARAYNEAINKSDNDLIVFCHQDVFFPESWVAQLDIWLRFLANSDKDWGVLGCVGITRYGQVRGHVYSSGLGVVGARFDRPATVQTLDEIVLILRKSSGLRFDNELPNFHLYGTDICLRAAKKGMKSYAISAFCIHNARQGFILPSEFYESCRYIKRIWRDCLPIQTTCVRISNLNVSLHLRRLREAYLKYIRHKMLGAARAENVQEILDRVRGNI
ncbi:MAG: glycosyltransferase [Candidatus Acidiferrales bacterium]